MNHIPPAPTPLTVTAKGQVTFRRAVLEHMGVRPGDRVMVDLLPGGRLQVRPVPCGSIKDVSGMLKREGQKVLTINEMNEVIADGWAGEL